MQKFLLCVVLVLVFCSNDHNIYAKQAKNVAGSTATTVPPWDFQVTVATPPAAFSLLSPSNGSGGQPTSGTLTWQSSTYSTQYDVYLDGNNPPTTIVSGNQPGTSYGYSGLTNSVTYFWKVVAKNGAGNTTATGSPWDFQVITASPPATFSLLSPSNGSGGQPTSGTLTWQSSTYATQYDVYLDGNNPPITIVSGNQPGTSYGYSGLTNSATYFWKVVAKNSSGNTTATGSPWDFQVITASPPAAFSLLSPPNGSTGQPMSGTLTWQSSTYATQYDVYLDGNNPPTTLVSGNQTGTSYGYSGLTNSMTYFWKVVAKNGIESTAATGSPWDFQISAFIGSVAGIVFNDHNADGVFDSTDVRMAGWKVYLKNSMSVLLDSMITDSIGRYHFDFLIGGDYIVSEYSDTGWIQTSPGGTGNYSVTISFGNFLTGKNFGNTHGYKYIGPTTGNWSNSSNWTGGHPPDSTSSALIPNNVIVTVDVLPADSIRALRVEGGGAITFMSSTGDLKVGGKVEVDSGGTVTFPYSVIQSGTMRGYKSAPKNSFDSIPSGIICYGDWKNYGQVNAGNSKITFSGSQPKSIIGSSANNIFHQLEINGNGTNVVGAIVVKDGIMLHQAITLGVSDTVIIDTDNVGAIQDTGRIIGGTVMRKIRQGEINNYRFESLSSYLKFNGSGIYPASVSITTFPNTNPPNAGLQWQVVGGVVDSLHHTIRADSVNKFSRWVLGVPHVSLSYQNSLNPGDPFGYAVVHREYKISPSGGNGFIAEVQLAYDPTEVPPGIDQSSLKLLRGPFYTDTMRSGWNMVSLPLIPEQCLKDSVFPTAISPAYSYSGQYNIESALQMGTGYWLRFPATQTVTILGDYCVSNAIPVNIGWNMIGDVSFSVPNINIATIPPGLVISSYFGYNNGYQIVDSLKPMHSYWLKAGDNGSVILTPSAINILQPSKSVIPFSIVSHFNSLTIVDAEGREHKLYFGEMKNAPDLRLFELPPLPPDGVFDVRYSTGRMLEMNDAKQQKDITVKIRSASYPIKVSWDIIQLKSHDLLNLDGEKEIVLAGKGEVQVTNPQGAIQLRLSSAPGENQLPKEFALEQNYPNPFNPTTTLRYQLPVDSKVTLKIYNLIGQTLKVLTDEVESAGYKSVNWNASSFASGIYFYRLEATSVANPSKTFTSVKKMVFIK